MKQIFIEKKGKFNENKNKNNKKGYESSLPIINKSKKSISLKKESNKNLSNKKEIKNEISILMDRFRAFITTYFFLPSSSYIKILFFGEIYIPINTIIIKKWRDNWKLE